MLREVLIERASPLNAAVIVLHHFFKRLKAPVVHVRCSQSDVAQRRHLEFAAITFFPSHLHPADIEQVGQAVVHELLIREKITAVTMKTIRTAQTASGIMFSDEQFQAALLERREFT